MVLNGMRIMLWIGMLSQKIGKVLENNKGWLKIWQVEHDGKLSK